MENLKSNIRHYMQLKGIKTYSRLLQSIAGELGEKGQAVYDFVKREKSNFTKMLNGDRPLKYEFIIPLEKIFGVSLARIMDANAYKLPIEKENVPLVKGFRYYAYMDDPDLYRNEFDIWPTNDGKSILTQSDEFGKTFLDYVVEYQAVNGVRYLHDEYGIKLKWDNNQFDFTKAKDHIWVNYHNWLAFARLVASMRDVELFNDIYDSYNMFFTNGSYCVNDSIFCNGDYLEILLDNDDLFKSIFEEKEYVLKLGASSSRKQGVPSITYHSINPIINNCLRYALKHLDKYKRRAIEMLEFGIRYDQKLLGRKEMSSCELIGNELGGVQYEGKYVVIVFANTTVQDEEVATLIKALPKFTAQMPKAVKTVEVREVRTGMRRKQQ